MRAPKQRITVAVTASGTSLADIVGVGPVDAATIIGYTKNVSKIPTRGHYATYNVTASIEVSSTGNIRHRLNLGGNRILDHAIHIAGVTQLRYDTNGRTYFDKKIAEGKTPKEAIRTLKRRISDAAYRALTADTTRTSTT